MLEELYIKNLALIDDLRLEFRCGLNVITGEPGSGKSLIVKALELLRGARSDMSQIRAGEDYLFVAGRFFIENEEIILEREVFSDGRTRARINGKPATIANLKELAGDLVEVHGQHENQKLLTPSYQRKLFDNFAGVKPLTEKLEQMLNHYVNLKNHLANLQSKLQKEKELRELRNFQLTELQQANLKKGEKNELIELERVLSHQEEIINLVHDILHTLREKDDSVIDELTRVSKSFANLSRLAKDFEPLSKEFDGVIISIKEMIYPLEDFLSNFDFSPERLENIRGRLKRLYELEAKYKMDADSLVDYLGELLKVEEEGSKIEDEIARVSAEIVYQREEITKLAKEISELRAIGASRLMEEFSREAKTLGFEGARFIVEMPTKPDQYSDFVHNGEPTHIYPWGFENVEFVVSLNPNEIPYPLGKVASGGELSRLSLLLREFLTEIDYSPTLVFDEVDSGIGGKIGNLVGEKLRSLSKKHQTIVITHLPQIASLADHHICLEKIKEGSRMIIRAMVLSGEKRVKELARMMGDEKYGTEFAKRLLNEKG